MSTAAAAAFAWNAGVVTRPSTPSRLDTAFAWFKRFNSLSPLTTGLNVLRIVRPQCAANAEGEFRSSLLEDGPKPTGRERPGRAQQTSEVGRVTCPSEREEARRVLLARIRQHINNVLC